MLRKILHLLLVLLIVILVCYSFSPFVLLAHSDSYYRAVLDNEYIDANYSGWITINFHNGYSCLVPETWSIVAREENAYVLNSNDETIAYCFELHSNGDTKDVVASIVDFPIDDIQQTYYPNTFSIAYSNFCKLDVYGGLQQTAFYRLLLQNTSDNHIVIIFPCDKWPMLEEVTKISDAIMYSFHFDIMT